MSNPISFRGYCSGDMECFIWAGIPEEDMRAVMGEKYDKDMEMEKEMLREDDFYRRTMGIEVEDIDHISRSVLYPNDIMRALGIDDLGEYKFTITAEKVGPGPDQCKKCGCIGSPPSCDCQ